MPDTRAVFERDLDAALGPAMRGDEAFAGTVYAALCNVEWAQDGAGTVAYTWRAASSLVARVRGFGEHDLAYYLFGGEGTVDQAIADSLAAYGWQPVTT